VEEFSEYQKNIDVICVHSKRGCSTTVKPQFSHAVLPTTRLCVFLTSLLRLSRHQRTEQATAKLTVQTRGHSLQIKQ